MDCSSHGTSAPIQRSKMPGRMCPLCIRTPVHYLSGPYSKRGEGKLWRRGMKSLLIIGFIALGALPAYAQQPQQQQPQLPDGPGKDIVQQICSGCHSLNRFTRTGYTPADWKTVIAMMRNVGAPLTPEQ